MQRITLTGAGCKRLTFTSKLSHGVLTLTTESAATSAHVTITYPETIVTQTLVRQIKHKHAKALTLSVTVTDGKLLATPRCR